jgi:DNA invertase Pin-like site-specific DNA recombinase
MIQEVAMGRNAIGVIRVSRVGERDGESFVSPTEQRDRIVNACERDGLKLVDVLEEPNVSGGAPLERRHGLREAVERVEAKQADVIVVAYFDRLVRSLQVQAEVVGRVETAGGAILAVDIGEVRADTASRWLSSTMLGMVAEYHRRVTAERTAGAKVRAIGRSVAPFPNIPPGYRRGTDNVIEADPKIKPVIAEAFRLRADGAPIKDVRAYLREHGVDRSFHGVQAMLGSRFYIGELHFGDLVNLESHEPIVDRNVWERVQRARVSRGRRPKSERLLARLGVLRCATCGARMIVGSANHGKYGLYRCPPIGDCPSRVTIGADMVEGAIVDEVKQLLAGMKGRAGLGEKIREAEADVARCTEELDKAVRAFAGIDVEAARERLLELQDAKHRAEDHLADLRRADSDSVTVSADEWDSLTLEGRRALVRATIDSVTVAPGRGLDRITVQARVA